MLYDPQRVAAAARGGSFALHPGATVSQQSAGQTGMALADPDPQVPAPTPKKDKIFGMERKTATMVGLGLVALAGVLYVRGQA